MRGCGKTLLQVIAPVFGQRRCMNGLFEQCPIVDVMGEEPVHLCYGDGVRIAAKDSEFVAGFDNSFPLHGKVETAATAVEEAAENVAAIKFCPELIARNPRLAHHENRGADGQAVSDVKIGFEQSFSREVFPEHAPRELRAGQFLPPKAVVLRGITVDRFVRAPVGDEIGLSVSIEVECAQNDRAGDGLLVDSGLEGPRTVG